MSKRAIITATLAAILVVATVLPAVAQRPEGAGPPEAGCPVGPKTQWEGEGWELRDIDDGLVDQIIDESVPTEDDREALEAALESEDRNGDGKLCVLKQVLPNDASGSTTWFVGMDNNSSAKG